MSKDVKEINAFFRVASKSDVDSVKSKIILSERQEKVFELYFIKRKDVCFIADSLFVSPRVINKEIHNIREKILKVI